MEEEEIESVPPSLAMDILQKIFGERVVRLIRYSWWPKSDVSKECKIKDESAFSLTYGPLGIEFENGIVIGIAEQPSLNSVVVWQDRSSAGPTRQPALDEDSELFPIDSRDPQFSTKLFAEIPGERLVGLSIIQTTSMNILQADLPSEVGLCFTFESGRSFVAEIGLHKRPSDFGVIGYDEIPSSILSSLIIRPLF